MLSELAGKNLNFDKYIKESLAKMHILGEEKFRKDLKFRKD
jgi:hypothetical protein